MKIHSYLATFIIAMLPLSCNAGELITLKTGQSVEIFSVPSAIFVNGKPSALMLKYRTTLPINNVAALRKEVDEIWEKVVVATEHAGFEQAVISANGPEKEFIIAYGSSHHFVFLKQNGSWTSFE